MRRENATRDLQAERRWRERGVGVLGGGPSNFRLGIALQEGVACMGRECPTTFGDDRRKAKQGWLLLVPWVPPPRAGAN